MARPEAPPEPPSEAPGFLGYLGEAGKQAAIGAVEAAVASPLRGAAAMTPETRSLAGAIEAIQQGADIGPAVEQAMAAPMPAPSLETTGPYQAGEAVSRATQEFLQPSGALNAVVQDIARGFGSVAGSIASAPALGPIFGGKGEAAQMAIEKGATPEQQERAVQLGTVAGATDYADLLLANLGSTGRALGFLKRVGLRAAEGVFVEGGQEGLQQFIQNVIARGVYNPNQDLSEEVLYNAFVGAVVGGTIGGATVGRRERPPVPTAEESAAALVAPTPTLTMPPESTLEGEKIPRPVSPEAALATRETGVEPGVIREPGGREIRFEREVEAPIFYSRLYSAAVEKLPESAPASQMLSTLRNQSGVKEAEIQDTGLEAFLNSRIRKVSKSEVVGFLEENGVRVEEAVTTSAIGERPEYANYVAPGPTQQYMELRLTVPPKPGTLPYKSPHWGELNVVAHVQATTRIDRAGNPVLHIEGLQSDWIQQGRKLGYLTNEEVGRIVGNQREQERLKTEGRKLLAEYEGLQPGIQRLKEAAIIEGRAGVTAQANRQFMEMNARASNLMARRRIIGDRFYALTQEVARIRTSTVNRFGEKVPPGPFKTNWTDLAIKRMIRWAADNGYSTISWNNGDLAAAWNTGNEGQLSNVEPDVLAGLRYFYDEVVPSRMKKEVKRFGGVLGATDITLGPGQVVRVQHVTVPASARTAIQKGLPLYDRLFEGGPRSDVNVDPAVGITMGREYVNAAAKMGKAFEEFARRFGFNNKVTLNIVMGPVRIPGDPRTFDVLGLVDSIGNGTYQVYVAANKFRGNIAAFYSTMMHEFGHVVVWEKFHLLPDSTKQLIREEYLRWRDEQLQRAAEPGSLIGALRTRQAAPRHWIEAQLGYPSSARISDLPPSRHTYHFGSSTFTDDDEGFHEYLADSVAKWATTAQEPLSIVQRAYSGIGKALRFFMEWMAGRFGIDPRPSLLIQNWLDSFVSSARAMTPKEYAALDIRTQRQNQTYVQIDSGDPNATGVAQGGGTVPPRSQIGQAFGSNPPQSAQVAAAHADKINFLYEWGGSILDLVQRNPGFTPLIRYVERVRNKDRDEKDIHDAAVQIAKSWRGLGQRQEERLAEFIDEITNMTYLTPQEKNRGVVRHPTAQEVRGLAARIGVEPRGLDVAVRVRQFTEKLLDVMADLARVAAMKIADPITRAARIDEINAQVRALKSKPYFPFMRFGRYFVTVKNAAGDTIYFNTFERRGIVSAERQQQRKVAELRANAAPGDVVTDGILPKTAEPFFGLSPVMLQLIRDKLVLTPAQLDALNQLQFQLSPARSFRHHFQHKRYVPGYSRDFLRAFSRYAFFGARYYAKTKYVDEMRQDIRDAQLVGGNVAKRIADFMTDYLENTILNSKGDYGTLKGMMFLWAMGYSPASATLNMTQTPMVTFPFLAAQFGDIKTMRVMAQTMWKLSNFYKKGTYENLQEWEHRAFGYGIRTGRIVETQSAELSAMSQAGILNIAGAGSSTINRGLHRGANFVMEKSALMFEMAEQWNRRIAFRAAMRLATENPNAKVVREAVTRYPGEVAELVNKYNFTSEQARAIVTAGHVVDRTQFVYASWARPRLMRGRRGTIFIFKRYLQSLLFLIGSDKKFAMRYVMLAMLMGGMGGVPGFEDLKNLAVAMLRWMGFNADAERQVMQMVKDYTGDAIPGDMVLHGLARRGFGIPAALDALGSIYTGRPGRGLDMQHGAVNVPFPQLDRSKAITAGPIIPEDVWKIMNPAAEAPGGGAAAQALGYGFSAGVNMFKAIMDNHLAVTDPKRWEKAEPRAIASLSKMYRALTEGRERSGGPAGGTTVTRYDIRDPEQLMEVIALGLGYTDLRRSNEWNRIMAENEHGKYIDMQRNGLMENFFEALKGGNEDELDRAKAKIVEFNGGLSDEDRGKRIKPENLRQSVQGRERERVARERGVPVQRGRRPIAAEFERLYPRTIELLPR
jgi:hypothetical protein